LLLSFNTSYINRSKKGQVDGTFDIERTNVRTAIFEIAQWLMHLAQKQVKMVITGFLTLAITWYATRLATPTG
jgi:hypothetical protein